MLIFVSNEDNMNLEAKILAWAFRQSFERADATGALLAHRQLCHLLKSEDNGSTKVESPMPHDVNAVNNFNVSHYGQASSASIGSTNLYKLLQVEPLAPFETIHFIFVKTLRKILVKHKAEQLNPNYDYHQFRQLIMKLWVAHDILSDPATRLDYDLKSAQVGGLPSQGIISKGSQTQIPNQNQILIGKLLQIAKVLEPKELDVAVDMHKAMPGLRFGQFLVTAGFLNQDELDAALLGQRLILTGKITVAQFEKAMHDMRHKNIAFFDTLVTEGWIKPHDIFNDQSDLWRETGVL
jgi:hypothetical protein